MVVKRGKLSNMISEEEKEKEEELQFKDYNKLY